MRETLHSHFEGLFFFSLQSHIIIRYSMCSTLHYCIWRSNCLRNTKGEKANEFGYFSALTPKHNIEVIFIIMWASFLTEYKQSFQMVQFSIKLQMHTMD